MAELLHMPAVAAAATSAVLAAWPLAEGARFDKGDPVVVVETDKAEVEVTAELDGVLLKTLVPAGAEVEVGSPIALMAAPGETVADIDALLVELGVTPASEAAATMAVRRDVPDAPAPASGPPAQPGPGTPVPEAPPAEHGGRIFASPLARKMAKEAGLPVESLNGTGPGGRIVRRDVEAAAAARVAEAHSAEGRPAAAGTPVEGRRETPAVPAQPVTAAVPAAYEDIPHTRMRRSIAARLVESKQTAPHFYLRATCRADALLALREQVNAAGTVKVSVNDLLIKAVAQAHVLVPEMNAIWTAEAIRRYSSVDVSVAIATDKGLVTPVLRDVPSRSITAVAAAVRRYADQAKSGGLQQQDLEGGSITITNLGMFGVEEFAAIINPPQSAILAVGAVREEPVVTGGAIEAARMIRLVLSVDHRPIDGVLAARWMKALTEVVEHPMRILL